MKRLLFFPFLLLAINVIGQAPNAQSTKNRALIRIFDSIYLWRWSGDQKWDNIGKYYNLVYDDNSNLTSKTLQGWYDSIWVNVYQYNYTYDGNRNQTNELFQIWNDSVWVNNFLQTSTYDENNNQSSYLAQRWNDSIWENYILSTFTYDSNNNMTSLLYQLWHENNWGTAWHCLYSYDDNNNLISELYQNWEGGTWMNNCIFTYAYDTDNNIMNYLYKVWNSYKGEWKYVEQYFNFYDVNNNLSNKLYQSWYDTIWVDDKQNIYTYDASNNLINEFVQGWNWITNEWVNDSLFTYAYDINYNLTTKFTQKWDGIWLDYSQYIYVNDADNFIISDSYKQWNFESELVFGDSTYYYFHSGFVGITELPVSSESISIYPNPSSTQFTIETHTTPEKNTFMAIYNLNGQALLSRQITEQQTVVDVSGLPQGIFVVKVSDDRTVQVGKFVKQ